MSNIYKPMQERVDEVGQYIFNIVNEDAKKRFDEGKPEHPFVHAQALLENVQGLLELPLEDGVELGDAEGVVDLRHKAGVFKESMLQVASLAGAMQDIPTISVILGMVAASVELLTGYHEEIDKLINEVGVTPSETGVEAVLKGIMAHE